MSEMLDLLWFWYLIYPSFCFLHISGFTVQFEYLKMLDAEVVRLATSYIEAISSCRYLVKAIQ